MDQSSTLPPRPHFSRARDWRFISPRKLSWSEALAEELRGTDLTVTCVCPGPTRKEFGAKSGVNATCLFQLGTNNPTAVACRGIRALRRRQVDGTLVCQSTCHLSRTIGPPFNYPSRIPQTYGVCLEETVAIIRRGPPDPPAIFIGIAWIQAPSDGSRSKLATFSNAGMSCANKVT